MRARILSIPALVFGIAACAQAAIPASQRATLEAFAAQTSVSGWNGPAGTECSWHGVTCNASHTTVVGIDLSAAGLYGILPPLDGLPDLQTFNVGQWQGEDAYLHPHNFLFGSIPPLNGLEHLKTFIAGDAEFTGDLPSLAGMANLEHFECRFCALNGHIVSLAGLAHLKYFAVTGKQHSGALQGSIPSLAGAPDLQYFRAQGEFTGTLPELATLKHLQTFRVTGYRFTGGSPDLEDMPELETFDASGLSGGPMGLLANLPKLTEFNVSGGLMSGTLDWLPGLTSLQSLGVGGNDLVGTMPNLSALVNLHSFYVVDNYLQGALPAPPQSLVDSVNSDVFLTGTGLCPNLFDPASDPPSSIDKAWNTVTGTTPWSKYCQPDPLWTTSVSISSSVDPTRPGQPVTFLAVVYGMHPTGIVTFKARSDAPDSDTPLITMCTDVSLVDQVATCTYADLPASGSTYSIYAFYVGDASNAPSHTRYAPKQASYTSLSHYVWYADMTTTDAHAQVGQPVDISLAFAAGGEGDKANFHDGPPAQYGGLASNVWCPNVPVYPSRSGGFVAHCVRTFTTPGPHLLSADTDSASGSPIIEHVEAATPFDADQFALTGPWYQPSTSGQGLEFAVYPNLHGDGVATLVGGWFTYDAAGHPRWMALQGNLAHAHGGTFDLTVGQASGGNFNAGPKVAPSVIGSAQLTFYDCSHAALVYTLNDGRSGTMAYVRLDQPSACSTVVPAAPPDPLPTHYADVLHGGGWYAPATSGQGLYLDFAPAQHVFYGQWFTYAPQGASDSGVARERWFSLQDNDYTPGDLALHNVAIVATSGGVFGQPSGITTQQVGTADITFNSCTSMTLSYHFDSGEFAGQSGHIDERPLGSLAGCQ